MEKIKKSLAYPKHPRKTKITLYNTQKDMQLSLATVRRVLHLCLQILDISTDEVILHFVSLRQMCALHRRFFDDPSPTDCITLPIDPPNKKNSGIHILGEVFICPKVAIMYAQSHELPIFEELIRYAVHGLLHLIGYDDMQLKNARAMKKKEEEVMKKISDLLI